MRALIISDIHSNFDALVAVAKAHTVDEVWCLGDLVDFGPEPAEVIQWVRHHAKHVVRGNHDHAMVRRMDCGSSPRFHALAVASRDMNRPLITEAQMEYLRDLPLIQDFVVEGQRCHLAHADPHGNLYRFDLTPDTSDTVLTQALEGIEADFIFCGHTHHPMVRHVGGKTFVNPGAVGLQFDGDPRASFAIWHDGKIKLHRSSYPYQATVLRLAESSLSVTAKSRMIGLIQNGSDSY
jgi:putative phosphoesterase